MSDLQVTEATATDAAAVYEVLHAAFAEQPRPGRTGSAPAETSTSVAAALEAGGGLLCRVDGVPAGALLLDTAGRTLALRRVGTAPQYRTRGVGSALLGMAEEVAASRGLDDVQVMVSSDSARPLGFFERRGYAAVARPGQFVTLVKALPAHLVAATADDTFELGRRLASVVRAGDVVLLTGELGSGKTTLTQGLGAGLGVRGEVTSPTFVISRSHPSLVGGPALLHVDAYRLGDAAELDDLDLDAYLDASVTVVEWGAGVAEALAPDRLHVHLARARGAEAGEARAVSVSPVGARWFGAGVRSAVLGVAVV